MKRLVRRVQRRKAFTRRRTRPSHSMPNISQTEEDGGIANNFLHFQFNHRAAYSKRMSIYIIYIYNVNVNVNTRHDTAKQKYQRQTIWLPSTINIVKWNCLASQHNIQIIPRTWPDIVAVVNCHILNLRII